MKNQHIKNMTLIGDSIRIIGRMVFKTLPNTAIFNRLLCGTQTLLEGFEAVKLFHSLRGLNQAASPVAKRACSLPLGQIWKNEGWEDKDWM